MWKVLYFLVAGLTSACIASSVFATPPATTVQINSELQAAVRAGQLRSLPLSLRKNYYLTNHTIVLKDSVGRPTVIRSAAGNEVGFEYDALGRLSKVLSLDIPTAVRFKYDSKLQSPPFAAHSLLSDVETIKTTFVPKGDATSDSSEPDDDTGDLSNPDPNTGYNPYLFEDPNYGRPKCTISSCQDDCDRAADYGLLGCATIGALSTLDYGVVIGAAIAAGCSIGIIEAKYLCKRNCTVTCN
jgi:YD repeat-containing protein